MIKLVGQEVCTSQSNKRSKSITKLTMVLIGLAFYGKKPYLWCQFRKSISLGCCELLSVTRPDHVAMASKMLSLKRVFSPHLNPEKHWYALNSRLCCSKPAAFCSTSSANLFPEEYKLVFLNDLRGEGGAQTSFRWFCQFQSSKKVYVA